MEKIPVESNAGRKWPWIIIVATLLFITAIVFAVKTALTAPVKLSNYGMQNYHAYDANINDIIEAKIQFNKMYKIEFTTRQIQAKQTIIAYKISDINNSTPVNNAVVEVVLTRPDTTDFDINLNKPVVLEGVYIFPATDLPKLGRWDILTKVTIGNRYRFYNLKADTRYPQTQEF